MIVTRWSEVTATDGHEHEHAVNVNVNLNVNVRFRCYGLAETRGPATTRASANAAKIAASTE
jgi:hypothetical protein